jgi:DNA-binding CsgD family transcriptional regulator
MKDDARLLATDLIGAIYGALLGNGSWQSFLDGLSRALPNGKATLFYHDVAAGRGAFSLNAGFDPQMIDAYGRHYSARNPWMAKAATRPLDLGVCAEQMLPPKQLLRTEFYADFMRPQDLHSGVGVTVMRDRRCNFMLSVLHAQTGEAEARSAAALLGMLAPHLRQAFAYYRRNTVSSVMAAAVGALDAGIVVVTSEKRVRWANAAGQHLLATGHPIGIDACGRLTAAYGGTREAIEAALCAAMRGETPGKRTLAVPPRTEGEPPARLSLVVPALTSVEQYFAGPCVVLLVEMEAPARPAAEDVLRATFALTASEARLARALAEGVALADAAAAQGITRETARTQLKRIFTKMDVHRQAQLVARLHRLAGLSD